MSASDATVFPVKNVAYRQYFTIRDITGAVITSWNTPTATISKDGGTASATSNNPVEIATNSGMGYIDLTSTEMNADAVIVKVAVINANAVNTVFSVVTDGLAEITAAVPTAAANASAAATAILVNPSNKIATDASNGVTVGAYETGMSPASQVLITPANKLLTNVSGQVEASNISAITAAIFQATMEVWDPSVEITTYAQFWAFMRVLTYYNNALTGVDQKFYDVTGLVQVATAQFTSTDATGYRSKPIPYP